MGEGRGGGRPERKAEMSRTCIRGRQASGRKETRGSVWGTGWPGTRTADAGALSTNSTGLRCASVT